MKKEEIIRKAHTSLESAEHDLQHGLATDHPELVDADGECSACVSMSHEMAADPAYVPQELADDGEAKKTN